MADVDLIDIKPRELLDLLKSAYYDQTGKTIQIGSNEFAAASAFAYVWSVLLGNINNATLNRFIDSATGAYLDAIAATYGIESRPAGYPATARFTFTYHVHGSTLPAGYIVVQDASGNQFTNKYPLTGTTDGESHVLYAVENGSKYNGIPANNINEIVDGGFYVATASNSEITSGGVDSMVDNNDAFREWLKIEIQSFAGAGTYKAYEARAKNADPRVTDSYVLRQDDIGYEKGKVKICILSDPDSDPNRDCVDIVENACSDPEFRPIGDLVETYYAAYNANTYTKTFQVTYPKMFESVAASRNARIVAEYNALLAQKINRPFVFEEFCQMLCAKDDDGVYAIDAKPLNLQTNTYPTPLYPVPGHTMTVSGFVFNNEYVGV